MVSTNSPVVYYAINNNLKYISYTAISIESILKHNNKVKIYLFIYGSTADTDLSYFIDNGVIIVNKNPVRDEYLTSLKWFALKDLIEIAEERLLFADADTFFFKDIVRFFNIYREFDFYGREEAGTEGNKEEYSIGQYNFNSNINHKSFENMGSFFKCKKVPIFNTGVMLFNNNFFRKIPEQLIFYESILKSFIDKKLPYPSVSSHIIDEIVSSFMFGKFENFSYGLLDKEIAPWYIELREKEVSNTGSVMHIWNNYYNFFWDEIGKFHSNFKSFQG
jgi:hypothetical protein